MNAYRIETRIPENRLLHIPVPSFEAGEEVEVIILAKNIRQNIVPSQFSPNALHGTLLRYDDPTEPISSEDWAVLK